MQSHWQETMDGWLRTIYYSGWPKTRNFIETREIVGNCEVEDVEYVEYVTAHYSGWVKMRHIIETWESAGSRKVEESRKCSCT
ncbi:hypothetical protein DFP98_102319 [Cohnella phaseoli]|uniref:Uncharacterized protein n=1 Tax=Cohnella phaseoli TaxID=456490 RepID=A0A3D9KPI1_9BACL|nr:hypothetical protein DFP98_102319 [Cohnella phaseoli]